MHADFPGKLLAYNCSPSFNWKAKLDRPTIAKFQRELGAMGFKFQFVTLAGFHALNYSMFKLAHGYRDRGMAAYSELQEAEFAAEADGYSATKHQREVGTGYFDDVARVIAGGESSTAALAARPRKSSFIEGDAPARGVRGADRQPAGGTLRGGSAERVPRLRERASTRSPGARGTAFWRAIGAAAMTTQSSACTFIRKCSLA